ncbi:PilZ domain-containing protein, partial [Myxococcota bacterium]
SVERTRSTLTRVTAPQAAPKTEPTGADRRETERIDQSFPLAFDTLTHLIKEFTHNISFGGMFVYTSRPLKKGEETAVTLVHPVHGERCTLLAKVVHSSDAPSPDPITGSPRYGVGVEFRMPLDELKRVLSDFISSHQQQKQEAPSVQVVGDARAVLQRGEGSRHALLGIDQEAPLDEIRRAYFQLVDRFHPDRYFGKVTSADQKVLEELFRQLTKAYEELTT